MVRFVPRSLRQALLGALALLLAASGVRAGSPVEDADFLDALSWGVNASSYAELRAMGRERWVKDQLAPPVRERLPDATRVRIEALQPTESVAARLQEARERNLTVRDIADPDEKLAARKAHRTEIRAMTAQAAEATILRALTSRDQLRERLTWFWFNHFNVYKTKTNVAVVLGDYVDTALRPHALGRFHDLLVATVRHPAMLNYLDNFANRANRRNENYAREIMELHTMGVGSGYSQADVENLARILTGVGSVWGQPPKRHRLDDSPDAIEDGGFRFLPRFHDYGEKTFLGKTIRGRGWPEVEQALGMISRHPATARHVSASLARYFMGGVEPSDALTGQLATIFLKTDGSIAAIMEALIRSSEFEASLGKQFKDPMRFVLSAIRLAYDERAIENAEPVEKWLNKLGQGLFNRSTPDGYPLEPSAWNSPGQLLARFEVAKQIGAGNAALFTPRPGEASKTASAETGATPARERPVPRLDGDLYVSVLAQGMSPATREALGQAKSPQDWNTLFLSSPEFMK